MSLNVSFCSQGLWQVKSIMRTSSDHVSEEGLARGLLTSSHACWGLGKQVITQT